MLLTVTLDYVQRQEHIMWKGRYIKVSLLFIIWCQWPCSGNRSSWLYCTHFANLDTFICTWFTRCHSCGRWFLLAVHCTSEIGCSKELNFEVPCLPARSLQRCCRLLGGTKFFKKKPPWLRRKLQVFFLLGGGLPVCHDGAKGQKKKKKKIEKTEIRWASFNSANPDSNFKTLSCPILSRFRLSGWVLESLSGNEPHGMAHGHGGAWLLFLFCGMAGAVPEKSLWCSSFSVSSYATRIQSLGNKEFPHRVESPRL